MEPQRYIDPVIAVYKRDVDQSLLHQNLRLTPAERLEKFMAVLRMVSELNRAARRPKDFEAIGELETLHDDQV